MRDTIFALASGSPPAAIALIRVSGPEAGPALAAIAGGIPAPRQASYRVLRDQDGAILDHALVLWFPGPASATGEDLAEFHCHGGRAVVRAMEGALGSLPTLRPAQPGEFTRRAFLNGRLDLAEAEGLADLLAAETELQRLAAQSAFGGATSRMVEGWRDEVLALSAMVEAVLDFSDEEDAGELPQGFGQRCRDLQAQLQAALDVAPAERLRQGVRVVFAGPPNSGKSSLFNALIRDSAAIVSPIAGTTRDAIERPVALHGVPLVLVDTAGLHEGIDDPVEREGIVRARQNMDGADIVIWLGLEGEGPAGAIEVQSRADDPGSPEKHAPDHVVSAVTRLGLAALENDLVARARALLPRPDQNSMLARQRDFVELAHKALEELKNQSDLLLVAESLREARVAFDRLLGRATTEDMLDALFGRFCIGK